MLLHLHVKNLALIEEAEADFAPGLNILTGETGAGKSILLGSIQLILGARFSKNLLRENEESALVELLFEVEDPAAKKALEELEIPLEEGQVLLSRRISQGRSICRINDSVVTASRMKAAGLALLDIHGQHEHQSLLLPEKQLTILDAYAGEPARKGKEAVLLAYQAYRKACQAVRELNIDEESRARETDFLSFEVSQIESAALKEGEDAELELRLKKLSNQQKLAELTANASRLISSEENASAQEFLEEALREMQKASELDPELTGSYELLCQAGDLLSDFGRELSGYQDSLSFDGEALFEISQRLDLINGLKAKYGQDIAEIRAYAEKQKERLLLLEKLSENLEKARAVQKKAREELDRSCEELSSIRQKAALHLSGEVIDSLKDLNFLSVDFSIDFARRKSYTENGYDEVTFLISTNPGESKKPLGEIVSGGELSRIMLAMKTILADRDGIETLIFDEIDTGISGRTAQKVSEKMALIAVNHQVLCITHLPQIAAMADEHFEIAKSIEGDSTITRIRRLEGEDSVRELARLLSGSALTGAVVENAREMKKLAGEYKEREKARKNSK